MKRTLYVLGLLCPLAGFVGALVALLVAWLLDQPLLQPVTVMAGLVWAAALVAVGNVLHARSRRGVGGGA